MPMMFNLRSRVVISDWEDDAHEESVLSQKW